MPRFAWAIGDVHGHAEEFIHLLHCVRDDIAARRHAAGREIDALVVVIGDMIDRGPQSRQVIEACLEAPAFFGRSARFVALKGNHEDALLRIRDGEWENATTWFRFGQGGGGGLSTLSSYGDQAPAAETAAVEAAAAVAVGVGINRA